jgi:hypothetical protein
MSTKPGHECTCCRMVYRHAMSPAEQLIFYAVSPLDGGKRSPQVASPVIGRPYLTAGRPFLPRARSWGRKASREPNTHRLAAPNGAAMRH